MYVNANDDGYRFWVQLASELGPVILALASGWLIDQPVC